MNNIDKQYKGLLIDILQNGVKKEGRNGTTYSVFGRQIRHDMREGFPLLTTKKMYWKGIVGELLWFLSGSTDIRDLWERNVFIWDGDWYKNYKNNTPDPYSLDEIKYIVTRQDHGLPDELFDLGPIYGAQWRDWNGDGIDSLEEFIQNNKGRIDQIHNLLKSLKEAPDSRRMLVNAWNVGELDNMVLPPCHYGFQVWTRELTFEERVEYKYPDMDDESLCSDEHLDSANVPKRGVSLMWNQRSVDTPLGLPFNIASYGLLLEMIANEMNMVPLELIGNLGDTHIYENQVEGVEEQLTRKGHPLPQVILEDGIYSHEGDIHLENYVSEETIKFPLSN